MKKEIAVLMAAGLGNRMYPLTQTVPKPLIKVHGIPMIETMINGLQAGGIEEIYVVVGYLKEKFEYLTKKYHKLKLIENLEYQTKNNISSIYAAAEILKKGNCFICEADVFVSDMSIFYENPQNSCYYGKMVEGYSKDWLFDLDEKNRLTGIHKGGTDKYNMVGIAYLKQEDAVIISDAVVEVCNKPEHENLFWDEIVNIELNKLNMSVHPVTGTQLVELDTMAELKAEDPSYINFKERD